MEKLGYVGGIVGLEQGFIGGLGLVVVFFMVVFVLGE